MFLESFKIGEAPNSNVLYCLEELKKTNGIQIEEVDINFYKTKKMNFTEELNLECRGLASIHLLIEAIIRYNSFNRHL